LARRALYGSSAGPLALRHGDAVAPARVPLAVAATWGLVTARRPLAAAGVATMSTVRLAGRLGGVVDDPLGAATRLSLEGIARSAKPVLFGMIRAWGPVIALSLCWPRLGRWRLLAGGALLVAAIRDWRSRPKGIDPLSYVAIRLAADLAYGSGVWWGSLRARTLRPLVPAVTPPRRRARGGSRSG
jgi:hypothetical protein